ncbi:MAG: PH domain-containing protein [Planctomycetes bacterium]|nr:PH domain-containing protein [Planctomycetota bacterium]
MIEIVCDACEKSFAVDPDMAGGKVPCPMCGDVNRVPAADTPPEKPLEPAEEISRDLPSAAGAEQEIRVVRPAMFRAHPFRYLLVIGLVVGGLAISIGASMEKIWPWLTWVGVAAAAAGAIWWISWWLAATLWIRVVITNKRTIRYEGIVRRHSTEVLHDHVRSVDIRQGFLHRMLNVGYIGVDSAGQDGIEIEIRDIPGPFEIKELIDQYRKM